MTIKNRTALKRVIYNSLMLLTLGQGYASDLNKEDLDKSRPLQFSSEYKAIARKYGRDYDTMRAPRATENLGGSAQEFRSKTSELLDKMRVEEEKKNKIGKAVVDFAKEKIEKKVENNTLKAIISEGLDKVGDSIKTFFFGDPEKK